MKRLISLAALLFSVQLSASAPIETPVTINGALQIDDLNISGVVITDQFMALATDEGAKIQILQRNKNDQWQAAHTLQLDPQNQELDLEALTWQAPYLYAIGSHSLKRKKADSERSLKHNKKRFKKVIREPKRYQLFQIKLRDKGQLEMLESVSLTPDINTNDWLERFQAIPSKENGVDIEGITMDHKGRLIIGFRGPVLRQNYAVLLRASFSQKPFRIKQTQTRFIALEGQGIRGLDAHQKDIFRG